MVEIKRCECGAIVKGITKKHLEYNMKSHKRGRRHKESMELKLKEGETKK